MDEIQEVLVKMGRKDLAQEYYLKIAANNDLKKLKDEFKQSFDRETFKEYSWKINKIKTFADAEQFALNLGWSKNDYNKWLQARNITPTANKIAVDVKKNVD